ncbi:hypothetical protein [Lonepinella sp. BR2882]|uniref:hypothetical protein n=1 Tax=Lonepinella sp. BR2882 TaxID=3095283 RepID=UPI003F6E1BC8
MIYHSILIHLPPINQLILSVLFLAIYWRLSGIYAEVINKENKRKLIESYKESYEMFAVKSKKIVNSTTNYNRKLQ